MPRYARSAPAACAARIASPLEMAPERMIGPSKKRRTSPIRAKGESVPERYKEELLRATAADIVYTDLFSGVHGNYLKHSVVSAGFDPLNLPKSDPNKMNFGTEGGAEKKVWRDIWSAGQGVGQIDAIAPVAQVVAKLEAEYVAARQRLQIN